MEFSLGRILNKRYIGLGKTQFKSSVAVIDHDGEIEIYLNERFSRLKNDGSWPSKSLQRIEGGHAAISENRDVYHPYDYEKSLDQGFPFFTYLKKKNLEQFSTHFNKQCRFVSHHLAHASSVAIIAPFNESLVMVMDGAGSKAEVSDKELFEAITLFYFKEGKLTLLKNIFQKFTESKKYREHTWSTHVGLFYEKIAEFIFASKTAAGKVMGLAPFGSPIPVNDYENFLENLDWETKAYKKEDHKDWEKSPHYKYYCDLAATAQFEFEKVYLGFLEAIKGEYPQVENIMITGGCALNCTANGKLLERNWFKNVFISPFPGDESIGLGCAAFDYLNDDSNRWKITPFEKQHSYFGPSQRVLSLEEIEEVFKPSHYHVEKLDNYAKVAELISHNEILCWFVGRSESGPRALGHRSILASPMVKNLKDYLNNHIKFREDFRPYGSSITFESASEYFDIPDDFSNPFMSFAVKIKKQYQDLLKEVSHIDKTSRMQTVSKSASPEFYELLCYVKEFTGHPLLLNTSFNKMGEPIVESLEDAFDFLDSSLIKYLVYENYLVMKK
jgi:carbamoyltransferase